MRFAEDKMLELAHNFASSEELDEMAAGITEQFRYIYI